MCCNFFLIEGFYGKSFSVFLVGFFLDDLLLPCQIYLAFTELCWIYLEETRSGCFQKKKGRPPVAALVGAKFDVLRR